MAQKHERGAEAPRVNVAEFARSHPGVTIFVAFETTLLFAGVAVDAVAGEPPAGGTGLVHIAGLLGALAVAFGALALLAATVYGAFLLRRRWFA